MTYGELHIAHPELIHGLWLWSIFVVGLVLLERRGSDRLARLVGPALDARLVERPAPWRRGLRLLLLALSGLSMVVALMRPQWGEQVVATPRVGAEIMIALDVSRSMLADDARPSRLERAKAEISDLLAYLENDQVGLIAFAGRASILAPLTPDKSFLRLALDGAGPHSVPRGGTRLAEPILRAIAGLGRPGPAQRALLLITDGEDHDSFALDAAKRAAAAGIKIITIGFGDEAGSAIHIRNPDDGSRVLVRDAEGNPVTSRLNGELLREIALATDGAYVPAGTGVLDLASIYETHIARLTKGQLDARGRTIRGELHPLFVGGALVFLVAAVSVAAGRRRPHAEAIASSAPARGAQVALVAGLAFGIALAAPVSVRAANGGAAGPIAPAAEATPEEDAAPAPSEPAVEDPRTRFNRANALLAGGEADEAGALYREARRDATDDVELRHAASYNLGMAAVARADALEAGKPEEALAALHEAADWFREAAAMRPDEDDARHNLDVSLRRALILADEIARKSRRDIEGELDLLIESQRGRVAESAMLLEAVVRAGELAAADTLRGAFDAAATAARELVADAEGLADRVADEKAIVESKPEAERTPEDALRAASLEGVLGYLDQGVERMGQTRRQLRQRSAERAYRRGAEALALLKRARDQLRDPVEQLGVLVGEIGAVARATSALAGEGGADDPAKSRGAAAPPSAPLPAFLTPEAVTAESAAVTARVEELAGRFEIAAERAVEAGIGGGPGAASGAVPIAPGSASAGGGDGEDPAASARLREALLGAAPLVEQAGDAMTGAVDALGRAAYSAALADEAKASAALGEARELFFDLRELLAVAHETEAGIASTAQLDASNAQARALRARAGQALAAVQAQNRARASRLEGLLANEREARLAALRAPDPAAAGAAPAPAPDPEQQAALEALFERAAGFLAEAQTAMDEASAAFGRGGASRAPDWDRVAPSAERATDRLDALRRLFLSLIEQLERLEREQVDLADRTNEAVALAAADPKPGERSVETKARIAAIESQQTTLETRAGAIADALLAESEAAVRAPAPEAGAAPSGPDGDTLRRAADHVASAQLSMQKATSSFADASQPLAPASQAQGIARDELRKAIELLAPPPPPPQEKPDEKPEEQSESKDQEQEDSESGEQEQSAQDAGSEEPPPEPQSGRDESASASEDPGTPPAGQPDPSQLLQGVRDREAERRDANERRARERRRPLPVEKDW